MQDQHFYQGHAIDMSLQITITLSEVTSLIFLQSGVEKLLACPGGLHPRPQILVLSQVFMTSQPRQVQVLRWTGRSTVRFWGVSSSKWNEDNHYQKCGPFAHNNPNWGFCFHIFANPTLISQSWVTKPSVIISMVVTKIDHILKSTSLEETTISSFAHILYIVTDQKPTKVG